MCIRDRLSQVQVEEDASTASNDTFSIGAVLSLVDSTLDNIVAGGNLFAGAVEHHLTELSALMRTLKAVVCNSDLNSSAHASIVKLLPRLMSVSASSDTFQSPLSARRAYREALSGLLHVVVVKDSVPFSASSFVMQDDTVVSSSNKDGTPGYVTDDSMPLEELYVSLAAFKAFQILVDIGPASLSHRHVNTEGSCDATRLSPVSYTHLTLPTILLV